jgi:predicted nucleotide-binding protein (sugar kinase/HSP70/actin superfamily)
MRIGIPEGLLFKRYEPRILAFVQELGLDVVYSGPSNRSILELGIKNCVDEACLPIKIFHGHVAKLREECDKIVVPRLMKCEYGESICPKFAGLPELVKSGSGKDDLIFTSPLYLNDVEKLKRSLIRDGRAIGLRPAEITRAMDRASRSKRPENPTPLIDWQRTDKTTIALLGHPYNTGDSFANMNLLKKLRHFGVEVINGEDIPIDHSWPYFDDFIKKPYWLFFRENYGRARWLAEGNKVDGIIYVSSFNCGTDSVTIEMTQNAIGNLPILVLKLDEHAGDAGLDTRIEAFLDLLERRKTHEGHLSQDRRQSHIWPVAVPRDGGGSCGPCSKQPEGVRTGLLYVPSGNLPPLQTHGR